MFYLIGYLSDSTINWIISVCDFIIVFEIIFIADST